MKTKQFIEKAVEGGWKSGAFSKYEITNGGIYSLDMTTKVNEYEIRIL